MKIEMSIENKEIKIIFIPEKKAEKSSDIFFPKTFLFTIPETASNASNAIIELEIKVAIERVAK